MSASSTKPDKRRGDPSVPSTKGWSLEFREKILEELDRVGDPIQVAYNNSVTVQQVMKCLARERHSVRRRRASEDRIEFLEQLDEKAKSMLFDSMDRLMATAENPNDFGKAAEIARKLLEGTKILDKGQKAPAGSQTNVQVNVITGPVGAKVQKKVKHKETKALEEHARTLLERLQGERDARDAIEVKAE